MLPGRGGTFFRCREQRVDAANIDGNSPQEDVHVWQLPSPVGLQPYGLRFISFFDWIEVGRRDLRLLKVEIERMDQRSEFVGRQALIELAECTVWVESKPELDAPGSRSSAAN